MILKITFNDNDFTQYIENFLDNNAINIHLAVTYVLKKYKDLKDPEPYITKSRYLNQIIDKIYNSADKQNEEDINTYIDLFKESFLYYLDNSISNKDTVKYLTNRLEITNVKSVKSKWQNGEIVYWFTSFAKYITM